jgi:phytoene synthase
VAGDLHSDLPELSQLAVAYAPPAAKRQTATMLALDARLATILRKKREPMLAQLRLAWWRDRLNEPPAQWPQGDAVLDSLRQWSNPAALATVVDGWEVLVTDQVDRAALDRFASGRAAGFAALAGELGHSPEPARRAGRVWALADLVANLSDPQERALALVLAQENGRPPALPRNLRPLAVLAGLGWRAIQAGGGPLLTGRGAALTALRLGTLGR